MKNFLILVDIELAANDEYCSSITDVYFGRISAETKEIALEKAKETVTSDKIKNRCSFAKGYDYYINVEEV